MDEQTIEMRWKVHNTGAVLEDGRLRAVFLVPDLEDEQTALALGVPRGTKFENDGSKMLLQHVSHELQDMIVKHRVITLTMTLGDIEAPPAPPPVPVVKARKAGRKKA